MALDYDDPGATPDHYNLTDNFTYSYSAYNDITLTEQIAYVLQVYFTPVFITTGIIGNIFSIVVFYKSKLRSQSTSQYLSALAVSDTIFLLQLIPPWLKAVKVSLIFARPGFCQMFLYFTYVSSANSSWLVVAFTVERFVAVVYPLRSRTCTVRRARVVIAGVSACCLAVNAPVLWLMAPNAAVADCNVDAALVAHAARFNLMDTVVSFTLPLVITAVLNVCIMIGVCRGSRAHARLTRDPPAPTDWPRVRPCATPSPARRTCSLLQRSQRRVTRMLLTVSSVFVLLNLPAYYMRVIAYAQDMSNHEYRGRQAALQQICLQFFNLNFALNFFLFCLSGQNFRRALCHTFPCLGRARNKMQMLCCCPQASPPQRTSLTNSVTVNTDGRSSAAVPAVTVHENNESAQTGWPLRSRQGAARWGRVGRPPYLQMWRFDNTRQHPPEEPHLARSIHVSYRPQRPTAIIPDQTMNPVATPDPHYVYERMFRPIPNIMIPGQIAPLDTETVLHTRSLNPSPSSSPSPSPSPLPLLHSYSSAETIGVAEKTVPNVTFAAVVINKEKHQTPNCHYQYNPQGEPLGVAAERRRASVAPPEDAPARSPAARPVMWRRDGGAAGTSGRPRHSPAGPSSKSPRSDFVRAEQYQECVVPKPSIS